MDVAEIKAEGLSRTFKITVPASELVEKLDARIEEMRPQMNLKGFRPGKVPAAHVKKMFGKSIMGELVENLIKETNEKALSDANIRAASQPNIELEGEIEPVLEIKSDLIYSLNVDIMPDFEPADVKTLKLDRPVTPVTDEDVEEAIQKLAEETKQYEARAEDEKAETGDAVVLDFVGKIDGEAFEGGSAQEQTVVIGAGQFIPGFEEQLIDTAAGTEKDLNVTFPEDYQVETLKGKDAVFEVKVREVKKPKEAEINDEFAKNFGMDDLAHLQDIIRKQTQATHSNQSRQKAKRNLLDTLDTLHDFDLPPTMVDMEFNQIWTQLMQEKEAGNLDEEDSGKSDDELKADYRKIAERRVRLGLVLAEIGRTANVEISEKEVQQAMIAEARKFPGQEQQVIEFFQKNPESVAQLRAPIYEEKVVDFILEIAKVTDVDVSKDELFKEDEEE